MFKAFKRRVKNVDGVVFTFALVAAIMAALLANPALNILSTWDLSVGKVLLLAVMQIPALLTLFAGGLVVVDFLSVNSNGAILKRDYSKMKANVAEKPSERTTYGVLIASAYDTLRDLAHELIAEGKRSGKKTKLVSDPTFLAAEETYHWLIDRRPNLVLLNKLLNSLNSKEKSALNDTQIQELEAKISSFTSEGTVAVAEINDLLQATREYHFNSPTVADTRPSTTGELLRNVTQMNQTLRSMESERLPLNSPTQLSKSDTPLVS